MLAPVFRIAIASIIAEVVSELIDTEMYEVWVRRFAQRWQWGRVLASNAVSVPVDTALFTVLAFWGVLSTEVMLGLFLSNILVKFAVVSIPGIYLQGAAAGAVPRSTEVHRHYDLVNGAAAYGCLQAQYTVRYFRH